MVGKKNVRRGNCGTKALLRNYRPILTVGCAAISLLLSSISRSVISISYCLDWKV